MINTHLRPFKDRTLDNTAPVRVYRNLHGKRGHKYSLMQRGLVIAHADEIVLVEVRFYVNEAGRRRVIAERRKNVHAFIIGRVVPHCNKPPLRVSYSPYASPNFMVGATSIHAAKKVGLSAQGVFAKI